MAKKPFKGPNKLIWGILFLAIALFLFYIFKHREGFQNNQTVPIGPPTTIPAKLPLPDSSIDETNMDNTTIPDLSPPSKPIKKESVLKSKTNVAVLRAKLDELRTLIDTM
jgi:hypothetical protein